MDPLVENRRLLEAFLLDLLCQLANGRAAEALLVALVSEPLPERSHHFVVRHKDEPVGSGVHRHVGVKLDVVGLDQDILLDAGGELIEAVAPADFVGGLPIEAVDLSSWVRAAENVHVTRLPAPCSIDRSPPALCHLRPPNRHPCLSVIE